VTFRAMQPVHDNVLAQAATAPIFLKMPDAEKGEEGYRSLPPMLYKPHPHRDDSLSIMAIARIGPLIAKAFVCLTVPPLIFAWPLTHLTFSGHFHYPQLIWFLCGLGLVPVAIVLDQARRPYIGSHMKSSAEMRWGWVTFVLFLVAFCIGSLVGDVNYLLFMRQYYFITSLKAYADIDPSAVTGTQFMDAGSIQFARGTRVLRDMGMSYTSWDIYCVAPIARQSSATGEEAGTYDMWAVGKNCCKSDDPTFSCGDSGDAMARAGLRQVNADERQYYALAVQQAKAAYNIQSEHPLFFHWVKDTESMLGTFFAAGFKMWVFSIFLMLGINGVLVLLLQHWFQTPPVEMIPKH